MFKKKSILARVCGPVFFAEPSDGDGNGGNFGGGAGGSDISWRDSLPDDMRNHPAIQDFKDITGLTKSYLSQQEMIGKDRIAIPGEEDTEGWSKLYTKLGRPDKAEGYEYKAPEGSEGLNIDNELVSQYQKKFYELGLSKKQGEALFNLYNENVVGKIKGLTAEAEKRRQDTQTLLKAEWGQAYEQNLNMAKNVIKELGDPDLIPFLEETGLGNDPRLVKIFYNIATKTSEDNFKQGGNNHGFISTPEQAKTKILQLQADDKFMEAYMKKTHPEHNAAVKRMADLFSQAYPEG